MEENKFENIEGIEYLEERNKFERVAIEIVIEEEKKENRRIRITRASSPFDIESVGNSFGDIRFIEVKGQAFLKQHVILSKREYDFASVAKDKYWLYIVYNTFGIKPIILKIQNPIEKLKWEFRLETKGKKHKSKKRKVYVSSLLW
jgi:hypothetical protein